MCVTSIEKRHSHVILSLEDCYLTCYTSIHGFSLLRTFVLRLFVEMQNDFTFWVLKFNNFGIHSRAMISNQKASTFFAYFACYLFRIIPAFLNKVGPKYLFNVNANFSILALRWFFIRTTFNNQFKTQQFKTSQSSRVTKSRFLLRYFENIQWRLKKINCNSGVSLIINDFFISYHYLVILNHFIVWETKIRNVLIIIII